MWTKFTKIFLCLLAFPVFVFDMVRVDISNRFETTDEVFYNPLMGFAAEAKYPSVVGENTLVYVDITWREWEPTEGKYAFDTIWKENNLDKWQQEGKHIVLRFICDYPRSYDHKDIPDWLYEKTKDGVFYDISYGKGYSPEYSNAVFLEKHKAAILALGKAFEDCGMVAYVQLGSLGHWGEWHTNYSAGVNRMPGKAIREEYVKAYEEAFPYAKILARRPFPETAERDYGVYNDMTGHPEDTNEWLEWIEQGGEYAQPVISENLTPQPNVWEYAPIGGEFTSSLSFDEMLVHNLDETMDLLKRSHTTFIGPKIPEGNELKTYKNGVEEVLETIGYRYGISKVHFSYVRWAKHGTLKMVLNNSGLAPIYFSWDMYLYIYDGEGNFVKKMEVPVDLTSVSGGENITVHLSGIPAIEGYTYWVGIENPATEKPAVHLDMDCKEESLRYQIFVIE